MSFVHPYWLYVGAASCAALVVLIVIAGQRRARALRRFAGDRLAAQLVASLSPGRRRLKEVMLVLGIAALFVALARPLHGYHWEESHREGVDLVFAVDTSKSMLARDVRPDRLTRARLAVEDLAEKLDGDRLGLVAFAGDAFLQTPLTLDRDVFTMSLEALDTRVIPTGGTNVAAAIRVAGQAFAQEPGHRKVLVLLTDGEDLAGEALAEAKRAAAAGMTIHTVGIGTATGEVIPVVGADGREDLVRDEAGQPVRSRLDEAALREIARSTGGSYQPLGQDGRGLEALYREALAQLPTQALASRSMRVYHEQFQWPLGLAALLLLGETLVGERRSARRPRRRRGAALAASTAALLLLAPVAARADAGSPVRAYNQGTESYQKGAYADAIASFTGALETRDTKLQQAAYYDLGNARYRAGQATEQKDVDATIAAWKAALEAYDGALALAPEDADARFNRDFVAARLQELERRKQEQQKDQQQQQQDQQGQGQQKKDQQGQGQGQPQKDQQGQGQGQQQKDQQGQGQQQKDQQGQGQQQKDQPGQGQPQKDQQGQGQGQQQKDQPGQGQPQKDQPGQGQGQPQKDQPGQGQPQQDQPGQQGQPQKDHPAQQGQQQKNQPGQPRQPQQAQPDQPGQPAQGTGAGHGAPGEAAETGARAVPGGLTRGEARQLLDSLDGELERLPSGDPDHEAAPSDDLQRKDW